MIFLIVYSRIHHACLNGLLPMKTSFSNDTTVSLTLWCIPSFRQLKSKTSPSGRFKILIPGGDEGIRTLDTLASIPHFQCGALDQLCDVSGYFWALIIQRLANQRQHRLRHLHRHLQLRQPKCFPIQHQFHATMDLRLQLPMFLRLFQILVLPCTIE